MWGDFVGAGRAVPLPECLIARPDTGLLQSPDLISFGDSFLGINWKILAKLLRLRDQADQIMIQSAYEAEQASKLGESWRRNEENN